MVAQHYGAMVGASGGEVSRGRGGGVGGCCQRTEGLVLWEASEFLQGCLVGLVLSIGENTLQVQCIDTYMLCTDTQQMSQHVCKI